MRSNFLSMNSFHFGRGFHTSMPWASNTSFTLGLKNLIKKPGNNKLIWLNNTTLLLLPSLILFNTHRTLLPLNPVNTN